MACEKWQGALPNLEKRWTLAIKHASDTWVGEQLNLFHEIQGSSAGLSLRKNQNFHNQVPHHGTFSVVTRDIQTWMLLWPPQEIQTAEADDVAHGILLPCWSGTQILIALAPVAQAPTVWWSCVFASEMLKAVTLVTTFGGPKDRLVLQQVRHSTQNYYERNNLSSYSCICWKSMHLKSILKNKKRCIWVSVW